MFGAEAFFAPSRRRSCLGSRGGWVAHGPVPGHETASLTPSSPQSRRLGEACGRTTPLQTAQACCLGDEQSYRVALLYDVSSPGAGTERSHTLGCRYTVWINCMRPCWQTGHTVPGSPAASSGGVRSKSTALPRAWGGAACPKRVRHCASFSCRTRLARKPKCRSLWNPCGGTWSISRRKNSTASSVRVRRRWPR